jgi:adenylosuccinate lyase
MRRNLDTTKGLLLSEAVMLSLGEKLGRQVAHDVVYDACMEAFESARTMKDALLASDQVRAHFTGADIDALLSPDAYTGLAGHFVDEVLEGGD